MENTEISFISDLIKEKRFYRAKELFVNLSLEEKRSIVIQNSYD